jgi:hypothetical protein
MFETRFAASILGLALLAACPAGKGAKTIRSDQPTVSKNDTSEKCDPSKGYDTLVVDWEPEIRGDLEVAMKEGVAVVAYDCNSIRLLEDCSIDGNYGFIGMTRKEKVVSMEDSDEVKANLPMSGIKFLAKIGGEVKRGTSLDAAMVMIGKKNSTRKRVSEGDLEEDCGEATHFVRSATLGAFVLATSSVAEGKVAANFFGEQGAGAGSASAEKVHNKDGDLEDCARAKPDANKPPEQCGALLRLSLKPIKSGLGASQPVVDVPSCPPGLVLTEDSCQTPEPKTPYQCEVGNASECESQCGRGHAGSCYVLGSMLADKDTKRALQVLTTACDGDQAEACRVAGVMTAVGKKKSKEARALLTRSCDGGDSLGCVELGKHLLGDKRDAADAQYVFRRACYGGEYEGCTWLGNMRQDALGGMKQNSKIANKFYQKGCKEGSGLACYRLGLNTAEGEETKKDPVRAAELFTIACQAGHQPACSKQKQD